MSELLILLHNVLRRLHVVLGFAGLAFFWIIIAIPKGTRWHIRFGKLFVFLAYVVGGTALLSSLWAIVHVDSFAPFIRDIDSPLRREGMREQYRFVFSLLLYLSAATISGTAYGVQLMRSRERHWELRRSIVPFWQAVNGICALGLMTFGIYRLGWGFPSDGGTPWAVYLLPLFLGLVGTLGACLELLYVYAAAKPVQNGWLYKHVEQMCGTGIAFHTAFIVFGANHLFHFELPGAWALLPWVGPPLIGISLTNWYVHRLKRNNGNFVASGGSLRERLPISSELNH